MKAWMSSNFGKFATELRPLIDISILNSLFPKVMRLIGEYINIFTVHDIGNENNLYKQTTTIHVAK